MSARTIIRQLTSATICCGAVLVSSTAHADQPEASPAQPTQEQLDASKAQVEQSAQAILAAGSKDSPTYGSLSSALNVSTDKDDTTATISFSFNRSHQVGAGKPLNGVGTRYSFATESFSVTATAPLGKNGKPSVFDFDTLGDDTSLKFSGVRYASSFNYLPSSNPNSRPALEDTLTARCIDYYTTASVLNADDKVGAQAIANKFRTTLGVTLAGNPKMSQGYALSHLNGDPGKEVVALADSLSQKCSGASGDNNGGAEALNVFLTPEEREGPLPEGRNGIWFVGASGTIARSNFSYLVQTPLATADVSKTKFKLEGFGGWIFPSGRASLTGGFSYTRTFKEGDETQLCEPNGVRSQLSCFTGPLGPPTETKRYTLAGEARLLLPLGKDYGAPFIGFAPRVSYEFKSDAFQFEVPVYFAPDKDGRLNGGVRFAYDTGKKDFAFGLFVGVPFSIFYN